MMSVIERIADWLCPDDPEVDEAIAWCEAQTLKYKLASGYLQMANAAEREAADESLPEEIRQLLREQQSLCLRLATLSLND